MKISSKPIEPTIDSFLLFYVYLRLFQIVFLERYKSLYLSLENLSAFRTEMYVLQVLHKKFCVLLCLAAMHYIYFMYVLHEESNIKNTAVELR